MGNPVNTGYDVIISSNGNLRWLAPLVFRSTCKLNVRFFPFDEQFCPLEFASWSNSGLKIEAGRRKILKNYTGKNNVMMMIIMLMRIRMTIKRRRKRMIRLG